MTTFQGHVVSEAVQVPDASETTSDLTTGDTLIPLAAADDFHEGSHVRIDGEVYHYDDDLTDDGEESGIPSVTIDAPGLLADVAEGASVESWNASKGEVISEWKAQVAPDADSEAAGMPAVLHHTLIPMLPSEMPLTVGDAVTIEDDGSGEWVIVNVEGSTPGYDPGFIRTGTLQADVQITVGDPDGKRVVIEGSPAIELYNAANEQTGNLDGEDNYLLGTLATGQPGSPRVVVGTGESFGYPSEDVNLETGHAAETVPGKVAAQVSSTTAATFVAAPDLDSGLHSSLLLRTSTAASGLNSDATLEAGEVSITTSAGPLNLSSADDIIVSGSAMILDGPVLDAEMRDGDVGTGTFRDSVDARVTALTSGSDAFSFFIGA